MTTLKSLYEDYMLHWKNVIGNDDYDCYGDWLHKDFSNMIDSCSSLEKCLLYNEYAEYTHRNKWSDMNALDRYGKFAYTYTLINHAKFNPHDDLFIEENHKIVSYSYKDFLDSYWDIYHIVVFIHEKGLENLTYKHFYLRKD